MDTPFDTDHVELRLVFTEAEFNASENTQVISASDRSTISRLVTFQSYQQGMPLSVVFNFQGRKFPIWGTMLVTSEVLVNMMATSWLMNIFGRSFTIDLAVGYLELG